MSEPEPDSGPRLLGVGKRTENAVAMQNLLRRAGYRARNFAISDDAEGDRLLIAELAEGYDAVLIGSFINGQHAELPASPQTTAWFNRLLNVIGEHAPGTRIVLVRKPSDVVAVVESVLGRN
ncbi:MAG: hypothetical protein ACJ762_10670 [Solirubrobacteraceae bacterium]